MRGPRAHPPGCADPAKPTSAPTRPDNTGPSATGAAGSNTPAFAGRRRATEGVEAAPTGWRTAYQAASPGAPPLRDPLGALDRALAGLNPVTEPADADLISAALIYARCADADPDLRCTWARYAYRAARQLWGDTHLAVLRISRSYQRLLTDLGHLAPAVLVCEQRQRVYQRLDLTEQTLLAGLDLSTLLHDVGGCATAIEQITTTWHTWQNSDRDPELGQRILLTRAVILAGCGHTQVAVAVLDRHGGLLDDPLPQMIDVTAQRLTAAETYHPAACRRPRRPQPSAPADQRLRFWSATLQTSASIRPAPRLLTSRGRGGRPE